MQHLPFRSGTIVFAAGASARSAGILRLDCPHEPGTPSSMMWTAGWCSADEEAAEEAACLGAVPEPLPLDISDFDCARREQGAIEVVPLPASRRYLFAHVGGHLALADPFVTGGCGAYERIIVDCLARAVAYLALRSAQGVHAG